MAKAEKKEEAILNKALKSRTVAWAKKYFEVEDKQSAKAKKLSKLLEGFSFGKTDKTNLAKLISEVTGENVVIETEDDIKFQPITALVLTKINTTDFKHTYETEKVLISIGDGTMISPEGKVGSMVPARRAGMRPATAEEIDGLTEAAIEKLKEEVNLVIGEAS